MLGLLILKGGNVLLTISVAALFVILLLVLLEFGAYVYFNRKSSAGKVALTYLLDRKHVLPHNEREQAASQSAPSRYAEHPFTGWTLNPDFLNIHGKKIHNREGFRCSFDFDELDKDALRLYIGGESTAYCTDIEENEETWPVVLGKELGARLGRKVQVVNGGVGGYNTFQSFIRLSGFIDLIAPHVVLIYHHAKNDLTPFYNGPPVVKRVLPDFSNLIRGLNFTRMSASINPLAPWTYLGKVLALRRLSLQQLNILRYAYNMEGVYDAPQLLAKRFDLKIAKSFQQNMVGLCRVRSIPLVYVTQLVRTKQFEPYLGQVNDSVRQLEDRGRLCFVCDLEREFPRQSDLFTDKLHFTPKGCRHVGSFLADFFETSGLSNGLKHDKK